jgi:hypothetical protein
MSTTAGTIVNNVRDKAPDPIYTGTYPNEVPQPDADGGLIRAQTLYRWLDSGVRVLAQAIGASVEDWIALPQVAYQPNYVLPVGFLTIKAGFSNQWPIDTITMVEEDAIWPSTSLAVSQSLNGYLHKVTDHLEFGLWPVPALADPTTTLALAINASTTAAVQLAATTNFLSFGYIQIDSEIIQYQRVSTAPVGVSVITRGACGTTAEIHSLGATVQHLGLWLKGTRTPAAISASTSVIELPPDITMHLETLLLSAFRQAENEHEEARSLRGDFDKVVANLKGDPTRKENTGQIAPYGEPRVGPLYGGGFGTIVR